MDGSIAGHPRVMSKINTFTNDDNHFAFLFQSTLGGVASHWFVGLFKVSVKTSGDLKDNFIVQYMGRR